MRWRDWPRPVLPILLGLLAVLGLCLFRTPALATSKQEVIRVGWPVQHGFTEIDSQGNPTGYTYDYLMEIAQYTGWEYEFVIVDGDVDQVLFESMNMLRDGEIDLLGALNYNEGLSKWYDYPGISYGTAYTALGVLNGNTTVTENNYQLIDGLKIAVIQDAATRNSELVAFCQTNRINAELIGCTTEEEQLDLLGMGQADAMLCVDVSVPAGLRIIAKFTPRPFYLATTKGNADIINRLNTAIMRINESDPYFAARLHEKYFNQDSGALVLSDEERAYIKQAGTLQVAYLKDSIPIQVQNSETGQFEGISKLLFDFISEQTGLHFEYIPVSDTDELEELVSMDSVDLVAGVVYDRERMQQSAVAPTRPYLSGQTVIVVNQGVSLTDLSVKRVALTHDMAEQLDWEAEETILWCKTVEECVKAVNSGEADYTVGNSYNLQYYASQLAYKNLTLVSQSGTSQDVSIGVVKPLDATLLALLNKVILSIPDEQLQAMIFQNAVYTPDFTLSGYLEANPWAVVFAVAVFAGVIITCLLLFLFTKARFSRQLSMENERYRQLCAVSGEYLYEYDYRHDRLELTEQSAQAFGCERVREHYLQSLKQETVSAVDHSLAEAVRSRDGSELLITMPDGDTRWFRATVKTTRDEAGRPLFLVGKLVDIQSQREEFSRLEERAMRDSLTGLYNAAACRRLVTERLVNTDATGALLLIDIDHFKEVNDEHGHYTGDQVLIAVSGLLRSSFREEDVVGRPGGDEFLVYLPQVENHTRVEERCRVLLQGCSELRGKAVGVCVTLSIGGTMAQEGSEYDVLYRRADQALYEVKKKGRNGFAFA